MTRTKFALMFFTLIALAPAVALASPEEMVPVMMMDPQAATPMPEGATFLQQCWLTIQPMLLMLIGGTVTAFVPLLLLKLNTWAKSKVHDARFHCAMDKLTKYTEAAVLDVAQTYVAGVRRSGSWGDAAALEAKTLAKTKALALLGPAGLAEAKGCLGQTSMGLDGILDSLLESSLVRLKPLMGLPAAQASATTVLPVSDGQPVGAAASTK